MHVLNEQEREVKEQYFAIEITETLQRVIAVKAESEEQANLTVQELYKNGEIVLTADDFITSQVSTFEMDQEQAQELYQTQNPPELVNEEITFG